MLFHYTTYTVCAGPGALASGSAIGQPAAEQPPTAVDPLAEMRAPPPLPLQCCSGKRPSSGSGSFGSCGSFKKKGALLGAVSIVRTEAALLVSCFLLAWQVALLLLGAVTCRSAFPSQGQTVWPSTQPSAPGACVQLN